MLDELPNWGIVIRTMDVMYPFVIDEARKLVGEVEMGFIQIFVPNEFIYEWILALGVQNMDPKENGRVLGVITAQVIVEAIGMFLVADSSLFTGIEWIQECIPPRRRALPMVQRRDPCSCQREHFGDVELVNLQKPEEGKPPLYAHVSFYTLTTVLRVLNGAGKVKFIINGKHLWARRFIPKKNPTAKKCL